MNLPNKLTLLRIILVPVFLAFLLYNFGGSYALVGQYFALITFVVAAVTDGLDGYIARKKGLVTKLGKLIDPLADKLLISAAMIAFVDMGEISTWPAIIIIGREFAVTGLRVIAAAEGKVIAASNLGKIKTNTQIIAIITVLTTPEIIPLPEIVGTVLIWIAVFFTIWSGVEYFLNARKIFWKTNY